MQQTTLKALNAITKRINLTTGLSHPNDRNSSLELLKHLHDNNIVLNSEEIYLWAKDNGWKEIHAVELRTIIDQLNNGHRFIIKGTPWWKKTFKESLFEV